MSPFAIGFGLLVAATLLWSDLTLLTGSLLTLAATAAAQAIAVVYRAYWQRQYAMSEAERADDFEDRAM
jgi:cell division protein FtsL